VITINTSVKYIENIHPFNEFFFADCIYNNVFSILNYMNISLLPLLLNMRFQYEESNENLLCLDIKPKSVESLENMLTQLSVTIQKFNDYRDLFEVTLKSIKNAVPVVVNVDCYYESIRKDTYHKEHLDHNLLIYGLDKKDFLIFEQSNKRTLNFKPQKILMNDLLLAAEGYTKNYLPESELQCSFFRLIKKEDQKYDHSNALKSYLNDLLSDSNDEALFKSVRILKRLVQNENINLSNINSVVNILNIIINNKVIQKKILKEINKEILPFLEEAISGWNYLILLLSKFALNLQADLTSAKEEVFNVINNVVEYEKKIKEQYALYYEKVMK